MILSVSSSMISYKNVLAVTAGTIRRAEVRIVACQFCDESADTPFSQAVGELAIAPEGTEFFMCEPARCPLCGAGLLEHDRVELL